MRVLVQRVNDCVLKVDEKLISQIDKGILVYIGIKVGDTEDELKYLVNKVANLRIFEDKDGKMNLSVKDIGGKVMAVSQFTLYGDASRGFRPSFSEAERPEHAIPLYEKFIESLENEGLEVSRGIFGADMKISYTNDGPVSIIIEKDKTK
ncbi:MAG: D-aminoacyl-tRNA deacylase [Clostridia bacterium]